MIQLKDVGISYYKKKVLNHIFCQFTKEDFACIIGKNGCGKSSLLRAMAGLQTYEGNIYLEHKEVSMVAREVRAQKIAYLPQSRPIPVMTVKMMVEHGRFPYLGFSKILRQEDKEYVEYALEITKVAHLAHREIATLSGGERQRVYLAMTVAQNADIILLDEPATFLDIEYQLEIIEILTMLRKQGKGIIMIAHDLVQAFSYANKIYLLADHSLLLYGSPEEVAKRKEIARIFGVEVKKNNSSEGLYPYYLAKRE